MKTRKPILIVLSILVLSMLACQVGGIELNRERVVGSGSLESEEREAQDVERVRLTDVGEMTIIQGDQEGLTVEADDNLLPYIETEMRGRELVVGVRDGYELDTDNPVRYTLRVRSLEEVSISGSANVYAASLDTGDLLLEVSGSGNMQVDEVNADALRLRVSGSGNFDLAGAARTLDVSITGSGNVKAGDLACDRAEVTVSGAGNVTVWASEALDVRVTGVGNVEYYGRPEVSQSITGGGEVKSLGEHR
jgi:hypothetical protein